MGVAHSTNCIAACARRAQRTQPVVHHNVITIDEAQYIIHTATPHLRPSMVVGHDNPVTDIRSSETAHISRDDPTVRDIIKRLCLPLDQCEALQVLRYRPGGFYKPHFDSCCDDSDACVKFRKNSGQRTTTVILGLNDGYTGGGTGFPNIGMTYRTPMLGALEFTPSCAAENEHGGNPVESGEKWIANLWVRERPF